LSYIVFTYVYTLGIIFVIGLSHHENTTGLFVSTDRGRKDCEWRERKWKVEVFIVWNTIERHRKEASLIGPTPKLFMRWFEQKVEKKLIYKMKSHKYPYFITFIMFISFLNFQFFYFR